MNGGHKSQFERQNLSCFPLFRQLKLEFTTQLNQYKHARPNCLQYPMAYNIFNHLKECDLKSWTQIKS